VIGLTLALGGGWEGAASDVPQLSAVYDPL
jgi:hypothetical protein